MTTSSMAYRVWNRLNGLLCIYKPSGKSTEQLKSDIQCITSWGLRKMGEDPPRKIIRLDHSLGIPVYVVDTDYSDHPLVIGPQYLVDDVKILPVNDLGPLASGVSVFGLNNGINRAEVMQKSKPLKVYHVSGKMGFSTINYFTDGKVVEKASYSHVHRRVIDRVVAAMQANHQKAMFIQCGVPLQSQAAYDLAVKGLIRPGNDHITTVYGMKCIHFEPPDFTVEVACLNETELFLLELIYDIGFKCRTVATCTKMRCIRYGPFNTKHALLQHNWNVENFAKNIEECNALKELEKYVEGQERADFQPLSDNYDPETHPEEICSVPNVDENSQSTSGNR